MLRSKQKTESLFLFYLCQFSLYLEGSCLNSVLFICKIERSSESFIIEFSQSPKILILEVKYIYIVFKINMLHSWLFICIAESQFWIRIQFCCCCRNTRKKNNCLVYRPYSLPVISLDSTLVSNT